jgi:hypothetical protein
MAAELQKRSSLFEQGLGQIRSSYNNILSAPLLAKGNAEVRDEYLKQAQTKLKDISSYDFSQQQNVQSAQQIFSPFWQDQDLLQDYSKSSQIMSNQKKANMLAESTDPKLREQFWQKGLDYVNISAMDMQNAQRGDGSIGQVRVNKYVPYFDAMKELDERAKNSGFKIETEEADPTGRYKIKTVNGDKSIPLHREWVARQLESMPQAQEMFRVEGAVEYRNRLNQKLSQGYDLATAKAETAASFIDGEYKANLSRQEEIDARVKELKGELDAKKAAYESNPSAVTPADLKDMKQKADEYQGLTKSLSAYTKRVQELGDKNSKAYTDMYSHISTGGEGFFSESAKSNFINNFARAKAAGIQTSYDVEPIYKMTYELEKERIKLQGDLQKIQLKEGLDGSGGSGSKSGSSSSSEDASPSDINTPMPVGLNIKGNDNTQAYARLQEVKLNKLNKMVDVSSSIITTASAYDTNPNAVKPTANYINALNSVLKTGSIVKGDEYVQEHKRLQDAGIIPKNIAYGQSPSLVAGALYKRAETFLLEKAKVGSLSVNDFSKIINHHLAASDYQKINEIEKDVASNILKDPSFGGDFVKDGRLLSKAQYLKSKFGYSDPDKFAAEYTKNTTYIYSGPNSSRADAYAIAKDRMAKAGKEYDEFQTKVNSRMGTYMQRYLNDEGAFIGPMLMYRTDRAKERDVAQEIALQTMTDDNLRETNFLPANVQELVSKGADADKLKEILQVTKNATIEGVINGVGLTKIGTSGKPAVKIMYDRAELVKLLGGEKAAAEYKDTLNAMNDGVEVTVKPGSVANFNTEWQSSGIDLISLDKYGQIKSPDILKQLGFQWNITKDTAGNQMLASISYEQVSQDGKRTMKHDQFSLPMGTSMERVSSKLNQTALSLYTAKQNNLAKLGLGSPNASWEEIAKLNGINY